MKGQFLTKVVAGAAKVAKPIVTVAKAKSPVIFAGTAIVGALVIGYTTFKCTPKYKQAVENEEIKTQAPVPKKQKAKIFVKTMWPMMVAILVTISSVIASHQINAKRIATLSAAYSLATQKATEAAEKKAEEFIKDKIGPEAADEYKKKTEKEKDAESKVLNSACVSGGDIYETGGGNQLFMDYMTGMKFRASTGYIESKIDLINEIIENQMDDFVTYQDVLSQIVPDCPCNGFTLSNGFCTSERTCDWPLRVSFDSNRRMENGEMAILMKFNVNPALIFED